MIKFSIVVGVLNQHELSRVAIKSMRDNLARPEETEIIAIDNGSDVPFEMEGVRVVRNDANVGNYPIFFQAREIAQGEFVAFLHSDVVVYQQGWDQEVIAQFDRPEMGLIGFIGSTDLDAHGGRGLGTVSNMQGRTVQGPTQSWTGSQGSVHGAVSTGMTVDGSVVDGCVMIFRKSVLDQIPFREDFPIHHFYDRLFSCQVIELGFKVGIVGIAFDHFSGQVANTQQKYQDTSAAWFKIKHGIDTPQEWAQKFEDWVKRGRMNPSAGKVPDQWDYCAYLEAERLFLTEYRDQKRIVPLHFGKRVS